MSVLGAAETDGKALRIVTQLDRKLYVKVNEVLQEVGGKWNRGAKAHLFEVDADDALDEVLATGEVVTGKDLGFFETPEKVVKRLIDLAEVKINHEVLEPSAGNGAIVRHLIRAGCRVTACEIDEKRAAVVKGLNAKEVPFGVVDRLWRADFLTVKSELRFDRVVMNPPFGKRQDIKHVRHAFEFLKPGGRLAAVMSAGVKFREDKVAKTFRDLVSASSGAIQDLPEGSFKESGTNVHTVVVTMKKH